MSRVRIRVRLSFSGANLQESWCRCEGVWIYSAKRGEFFIVLPSRLRLVGFNRVSRISRVRVQATFSISDMVGVGFPDVETGVH